MTWLSVLFAAFLSVALIAFGWMPCCCNIACVTCPSTGAPTVMHGLFATAGAVCTDFNGLAVDFTYNPATFRWEAPTVSLKCTTCGLSNIVMTIDCVDATHVRLRITQATACSGAQYACGLIATPGSINQTSLVCSPFQVVFGGTLMSANGVCPDAGATWTLTATS